jgi:hypothetical protein
VGEPSGLSEVEVELLGVARLLARRETACVALNGPVPLAEFLRALAGELPALVGTVFTEDGALLGGHVLSRNGADLLRDPEAPVSPGDRLLLLSTAAGG